MSDKMGDVEDKCDLFLFLFLREEEDCARQMYCLRVLEIRMYEFRSRGDVKMVLRMMRRRRRKRIKEEEKERRENISTWERRHIFILFRAILTGFESASFDKKRIRERNSIRQGRDERRDPAWLQRQQQGRETEPEMVNYDMKVRARRGKRGGGYAKANKARQGADLEGGKT